MTTKTEQALALIAEGQSVRQAARAVDVSESAVHAAVKRQKATVTCPCCDAKVASLQIPEQMAKQIRDWRAARS